VNTNVILGVAAIGYGIYTLFMRRTKPQGFGKLEAMRAQWGHGAGTAIHVIAYTALPLIAGVVLLYLGLQAR